MTRKCDEWAPPLGVDRWSGRWADVPQSLEEWDVAEARSERLREVAAERARLRGRP